MSSNEESSSEQINENSAGTAEAANRMNNVNAGKAIVNPKDLGFLNDVQIILTIEVGRTDIKIRDLLNLSKDSIIELNKSAGEPVDIYANGKLISKGNIITANGKYCVRLTSIAQPLTGAN